jgi:hypothetical protein
MLKIGNMSSHMSANCVDAQENMICSFDANAYGEVVSNITINSVSAANIVEQKELIKADFMAFIDTIVDTFTFAAQPEVEVEPEIEEE